MKTSFGLSILATLCLAAYSESNPYTDKVQRSTPQEATEVPVNRTSNPVIRNIDNIEDIEEETQEVAPEGEIAKEKLTSTELVCGNADVASKFPAEMGFLCLNGKATQTFADLLAKPYQGAEQLPPQLLKGDDINGVSHMILVSSSKIPKTIDEILNRKELMNGFTVEAPNASFRTTQLSVNQTSAADHLASFDVSTALTVSVGIITINDTALQVRDLRDISGDGSVIADLAYLKANDPANDAAILSNNISFWITDGTSTTMIVVTHQQVNNRGQHPRALETFGTIGQGIERTMYGLLNN